MKKSTSQRKVKSTAFAKLSKVERAIILLADYMEHPNHDQYHIQKHVLDILGYEKESLSN